AVGSRDLTRGIIEDVVVRWPLLRHTLDRAGHEPLRTDRVARRRRLERPRSGDERRDPPVVFLGLDAFDVDLLDRVGHEHLGRLMARARVTPTEAPPGLFTGAVWPSVWTGSHAGQHGYHCWKQIRPGTYDFELHQVHHDGLARPPFWDRLREDGRRAVVIDAPHAPMVEGLPGAQVLEWGGHDAVTPPFSDPPELIDDVLDRHGEHPSWGNCNEHDRDAEAYGRFRDDLVRGAEARADLTLELDERIHPDLLVSVFSEPHCVGHQAWHLHDARADGHDAAVVAALGDPVRDVYAAVDRGLGRILAGLDPDSEIFVLLSHGMGTHTDPTYLVDDVLLRLDAARRFERARRRVQAGERLVARLGAAGRIVAPVVESMARRLHRRTFDWIHAASPADRRWFQQPNNEPEAGIRFNVVGREPQGIVEPEAFDDEVAWLRTQLHALRDAEGREVVRDVLVARDRYAGPALDALPDLFVRWHRRSSMADRLVSPLVGEVHRPYAGARTGDHHPRGLLIHAGPGVEPGVDEGPIPSEAIAARVLDALDRASAAQV
ncbi:MAG: alkaline phosphatase family protein, partial [Actinomycetota bacterium]